jgi:hypothetical protein
MYDVAIQIVNYKTKTYLDICLEGLLKDIEHSNLNYVVNVLDNASGDNLFYLKEKYPIVSFHQNSKNVGYGNGHNILAEKTQAKYLLLLNPDIGFMEPKTVERLYARIEDDNEIKVIGPQLITIAGKAQQWDHGEIQGLLARIASGSGTSFWKEQHKVCPVAWVSGAAFLIRKDVFDNLNGFDENFFLYKEEEELCLRVRDRGGKVIYDPLVKMLHVGGVVAKKSEHMQKSIDYYLDKHFKGNPGYYIWKLLNKFLR